MDASLAVPGTDVMAPWGDGFLGYNLRLNLRGKFATARLLLE